MTGELNYYLMDEIKLNGDTNVILVALKILEERFHCEKENLDL